MGIRFRTKHPIAKPRQSAIRDHYEQCGDCGHCDISVDNFKILDTTKEVVHLRILESIYIFKRKILLSNVQSAFSFLILSKLYSFLFYFEPDQCVAAAGTM